MEKYFNTINGILREPHVTPVSCEAFDFVRYAEYEESLKERQKEFLEADEGILVYRRVRADGVFYDKCRDWKESLELQLGALQKSLEYQADIANFLEPGMGSVISPDVLAGNMNFWTGRLRQCARCFTRRKNCWQQRLKKSRIRRREDRFLR